MTHRLHTFRSSFSLLSGIEKAIKSRSRAGKRSITRSIAGLAVEHTLDVTQFGLLRKDDAFEVVFDPGTDKVEQLCLGPVPAICGDTGSWRLITATQPRIHRAAESEDFSGLWSAGHDSSAA